MHCLSNWNTFPVYQSGKTDVIKTINCYYVSKNNWNRRTLCIKEQVDCKIKGCLHIIWLIHLTLSIISHFIAVPTLGKYSLVSALNSISAVPTLSLHYNSQNMLLVYSTFRHVKNRSGERCNNQLHTLAESKGGLYSQILPLVIGAIYTYWETLQNTDDLWAQP